MLFHFMLLLIPITAISLNNLKSNCNCQPSSSPCTRAIFCSDGSSANNIDQRINKKIQLGKLKLKKRIWNDKKPIEDVKRRVRPRILKRSTMKGSPEDDSDLITPQKQNAIINRAARGQGIPIEYAIDKNQLKFSKIIKDHSEIRMDVKCNSQELRELMLESISDNSSVSKHAINDRAEAKFGSTIDVVCSKGHFSYVYSSNLYCEATKGDVTCIAFRQVG